jgi:ankyrin repeat protein
MKHPVWLTAVCVLLVLTGRALAEEDLRVQADRLFAAKSYEEAERAYRKAVEQHPQEARLHARLGACLTGLKRHAEAQTAYAKAVQLQPKSAFHHHELGTALFNLKDYAKAVPPYEQAVHLDPDKPLYHANLAGAALRANNVELARKAAVDARLRNCKRHWVFGKNGLGLISNPAGDFSTYRNWIMKEETAIALVQAWLDAGGSIDELHFHYLLSTADAYEIGDLTLLHEAAHVGHAKLAKLLIGRGASLTLRTHGKGAPERTALEVAAVADRPHVAAVLLEAGAKPTPSGEVGALRLARSRAMAELLVAKGAKVEGEDKSGWTPLMEAAREGRWEVLEVLLAHGARLDAPVAQYRRAAWNSRATCALHGGRALHLAASSGHLQATDLLLARGAKPDARSHDGSSSLHVCHEEAVLALLLARGGDPNAKDALGRTPLHGEANAACAALLLRHGGRADARDSEGATPLHRAAHRDVTAALLRHGADANARMTDGRTPLHTASGHLSAEALLAAGAQLEARTLKGLTPLHTARDMRVAALLIERGLSVDDRDATGNTPLHHAVQGRKRSLVVALLEAGAAVNATNAMDETPLHLTSSEWMATPLLKAKAGVNRVDASGRTPLHRAVLLPPVRGRAGLVQILLRFGADREAKDKAGKTALDYARERKAYSLIRTLGAALKGKPDG